MDFVTVIILYLKRSYPILGRDGKRYKLARVWSKQPFIFLSFKLSSSSVAGYFVVQIIWCALYVFLGKRREKLFDWWERINSPKFRLFVIKHELRGFPAIHLYYKRNWLCLIFHTTISFLCMLKFLFIQMTLIINVFLDGLLGNTYT